MVTAYEKMRNQEWYDANNDPQLKELQIKALDLCFDYNHTRPSNHAKRHEVLKEILGEMPENLEIIAPLRVDYEKHIHFGKNVFVNSNVYFMDGNDITIGDNTFIGPHCGFYTNAHPEDVERRNEGLEKALPITVEKNVWFGANVSIMPGVTIGEGTTIGAGSTVTRDIPKNVVAAGSPCRVLRKVNPEK